MPINLGLAALLMSGAMNAGEPAAKLTLGADAFSQTGSAPLVLVQSKPLKKPQPRKVKKQPDASAAASAAAPAATK